MDFKIRMSFDFPKSKVAQIEQICKITKCSMAEVISKSLDLYAQYSNVVKSGKKHIYFEENSDILVTIEKKNHSDCI